MQYFKVLHLGAGTFPQGSIVTEEKIKKGGFDLDHWLKVGAVEKTADPDGPKSPLAAPTATAVVIHPTK